MFKRSDYRKLSLEGGYVEFPTPNDETSFEEIYSKLDRRRSYRSWTNRFFVIVSMLILHYFTFRMLLGIWSGDSSDQEAINHGNKIKILGYDPMRMIYRTAPRKDPVLIPETSKQTFRHSESKISNITSLSYDDMMTGSFVPHVFYGNWLTNDDFIFFDIHHNLMKFDSRNREMKRFIETKTMSDVKPFPSSYVDVSADQKYLVYNQNVVSIFRYSTLAEYLILDMHSGNISQVLIPSMPKDQFSKVKFGPRGSQLIAINGNDIYYASNATDIFKLVSILSPGMIGKSYNGIPDWVYEEEILKSDSAYWFSPRGSRLAFLQTEDDSVSNSLILTLGSLTDQNMGFVPIKYPKPGGAIPVVSVHVIELDSKIRSESVVAPPFEVINSSESERLASEKLASGYYITSVTWIDDERLVLNFMSRNQKMAWISICGYTIKSGIFSSYNDWKCEMIFKDSSDRHGGWVSYYQAPLVSSDAKSLALIVPNQVTTGDTTDHYSNIMLIDIATRRRSFLFKSPLEVKMIKYFGTQKIYFEAVPSFDPLSQHLYYIKVIRGDRTPRFGNDPLAEPVCLTCKSSGKSCDYSTTYFPNPPLGGESFTEMKREDNATGGTSAIDSVETLSYFIRQCQGPEIPFTDVWTAREPHRSFQTIENNALLKMKMRSKLMPEVKFMRVTLDDGTVSNIKLIIPSNGAKGSKYPLLIKNYGAPRYQSVTKRIDLIDHPWNTYLASSVGIITAIIDARGSANQGFKRSIAHYRNLGSIEVGDQILVARHLVESLPNIINDNAIAIMGISYGGYVALKSMVRMSERNDNLIKCAIAVSPVADWYFYDAVYSERYMGLPSLGDNEKGYTRASLFPDVDQLIKQKIFLIHGSADDNVHIDQILKLMRHMVDRASKDEHLVSNLRYMIYPDQNHYFENKHADKHMLSAIEQYLKNECF